MPLIIETLEEPVTTKPTFDVGSQDDQFNSSDSEDSDTKGVPQLTEAQVEAVRYVLACRRKDYRKILKLGLVAKDTR